MDANMRRRSALVACCSANDQGAACLLGVLDAAEHDLRAIDREEERCGGGVIAETTACWGDQRGDDDTSAGRGLAEVHAPRVCGPGSFSPRLAPVRSAVHDSVVGSGVNITQVGIQRDHRHLRA